MLRVSDLFLHGSQNPAGLVASKGLDARVGESEELYRGLASVAFDGVAVHVQGIVLQASRSFEQLFGLATGSLMGRPIRDLVVEEQRDYFLRQLNSGSVVELECLCPDGHHIHVEASSRACRFFGEEAYATAVRDISVRKRDLLAIRRQADFDSLTGLPNRLVFYDRLCEALEQAAIARHPLAVLFLDLDRFKNVNDALGHNVGDVLLFEVAERLQACLRGGDVVSRLGGDEFTVMLKNISNAEEATAVAGRIVKAINQPYLIQEQSISVGVSVGIALYPEHAEHADTLIHAADMAMYHAKDDGRNHYEIYSPDKEGRRDKLALEDSLRRGIEAGEFVNYYQPRVDLRSGKVEGAEALARWQHPQRGLVLPDDFIPLAEETLLILPLGLSILDQACRQAKAWEAQGTSVSINLSPLQLYDPSLLDCIDEAVRASGVRPAQIEFEVTETAAMKNVARSLGVLRELDRRGFRLALDDFGKGYSSLNYLKQFPVSTLKIDMAFIHDVLCDPKDSAIVRTIITLGHNLGMRVLAEGVEDSGQAEFLASQGCDLAQGFLYSKPVQASAFESLRISGIPQQWSYPGLDADDGASGGIGPWA